MSQVDILKAALFTPAPEGFWGMPMLLWGEPGTGKTHAINAICRQYGLANYRLSPGEQGEGGFGVVPVPGDDSYLHFPPPAWVADMTAGGVIFVDEINLAPPANQPPLMGVSQLRVLGSHKFGPRTRVLSAANETQDSAGGWDLPLPVANRFGHLEWRGLAPREFAVALMSGFAPQVSEDEQTFDALVEEERVMKLWPAALARACGLVSGYVIARGTEACIHAKPQRAKGAPHAWPSRRTVTYATHALAAAEVHGLSEIDADEFVASFVGRAWATDFSQWVREQDLPDPADILDGRVKFQHDVRRLDRTIAVLSSCAATVVPADAERRIQRASALWAILAGLLQAGQASDAAIPPARALTNALLVPPIVPGAHAAISKVYPILKGAGFRIKGF